MYQRGGQLTRSLSQHQDLRTRTLVQVTGIIAHALLTSRELLLLELAQLLEFRRPAARLLVFVIIFLIFLIFSKYFKITQSCFISSKSLNK